MWFLWTLLVMGVYSFVGAYVAAWAEDVCIQTEATKEWDVYSRMFGLFFWPGAAVLAVQIKMVGNRIRKRTDRQREAVRIREALRGEGL